MSKLKRVVVGLDGSSLAEAALPYAEVFARAHRSALVLVRAVNAVHNPGDIPERRTGTPADDELGNPPEMDYPGTRRLVYEAERYLAEVAQQLRERGSLVEVAVVIGEPAEILVEESRLRDAEMIVLSTHGRSGFGRWIYSSVADQVMREATVPVLLVSPTCRLPLPRDRAAQFAPDTETAQIAQTPDGSHDENADVAGVTAVAPARLVKMPGLVVGSRLAGG